MGLGVCALGMIFGLVIYMQLKNAPVHKSMLDISELIYETCKTYLVTQIRFIMMLEALIGAVIVLYFGVLEHFAAGRVIIILAFSLLGIAGSCAVAWFGIRVNTFANSRTAFGALEGKPFPCYAIPLKAGMSIGMLLISVELVMMLGRNVLLFVPGEYRRQLFHRLRHRRSRSVHRRFASQAVFSTKIADIGSEPHAEGSSSRIKEDATHVTPASSPTARATTQGDSVGPSADGFETYGVTGVRAHHFHSSRGSERHGAGSAPHFGSSSSRIVTCSSPAPSATSRTTWIAAKTRVTRRARQIQLRASAHHARVDHRRSSRIAFTWAIQLCAHFRISARRHDVVGRLSTIIQHRNPREARRFRARQSLHVDRIGARRRSRHVVARKAEASLNILNAASRQRTNFQRVLARHDDDVLASGRSLSRQPHGRRPDHDHRQHGRVAGLRVRSRRLWIPRNGPGHHCCRLVRSGHGQRAVGL